MKRFLIALVALFSLSLLGASPFVRTNGEPNVQGPLHLFDGLINTTKGITSVPVTATTGDLTLYVRTTGNDNNDGLTEATALLTIQEAVDRVPKYIKHNVTVDMGEGNFDGAYVAGFSISGTSPSFLIKGVLGNPTLTTGTTSGTATGGGTRDVVDSGQTWTVDELIGYLALVDGVYRVIYDNDATSFQVVAAYSGATSGKAYEILEQKTNIDTAETTTGYGGLTFKANLIQIAVEDIKCTGMMIGIYNGYSPAGSEPERCRFDSCTLVGFYEQDALEEATVPNNAAIGCNIGFQLAQGSQLRSMNGCLAYNSTDNGFVFDQCFGMFAADDLAAINNGGDGIHLEWIATGGFDFDQVVSTGNGGDGIKLLGVYSVVDLDVATISDNGGYGIVLDNNANGNKTALSFLNATGTITISNNALGGIIAKNHSIVALTNCSGSNTAGYGLELQTGSYATITSATTITGASGDATINGGTTPLTWATDFNDDGDIVTNVDNSCRIERKD